MIKHINHIGIAVQSLDEQVPFYRDVLGLEFLGIEEVAAQKVKVAMFQVGDAKIELLEPTHPESAIAKHLESKGEGMHHIAYETDDVTAEIAGLKSKEVRMIDETPRGGAHGTQIAFIHPKSSGKVLTELCQSGGMHE